MIDWAAPWLAPYASLGRTLDLGASCADALNAVPGAPVRFVEQSALPAGMAYEQFIYDTGQVPTRDNAHDLFNGLCWLRFPATKLQLNRLQAQQIAQDGIGQVRGALRDALTVFDENAAFFSGPDALWQALVAKDWQRVFAELRPAWRDSRVQLFGHALLEKLLTPRKAITAHVYRVPEGENAEAWMAEAVGAGLLSHSAPAHLPVLGVPGWWPDNENSGFYADASVFRAPRQSP